ncbi:MAG TPA: hypothetical protein VF950_25615 [Planctomycetota bacterium]
MTLPDGVIGREIRILDSGEVSDSHGEAYSIGREDLAVIKTQAVRVRSEAADPRRASWSARFISFRDETLLQVDCPEPRPGERPSPAWGLVAHILGMIDPDEVRRLEDAKERAQPVRAETLARALADGAAVSVVLYGGSPYEGFTRLELAADGAARVTREPRLFPPSSTPPTSRDARLPANTLRDALEPLLGPEPWPKEILRSLGGSSWTLEIILPTKGEPARRTLPASKDQLTIRRLRDAIALAEAATEAGPSASRGGTEREHVEQAGPCPWCPSGPPHDVVTWAGPVRVLCSCGGTAFLLDDVHEAPAAVADHFSAAEPDKGENPWATLERRGVLRGPSGPTPDGRRWRGWFRRPEDEALQTELMTLLKAVERGEVTLTTDVDPEALHSGNLTYQAGNGWSIVLFIDALEWDYFESFTAPDGRFIDPQDLPWIRLYAPAPEAQWKAWGIPHPNVARTPRWLVCP